MKQNFFSVLPRRYCEEYASADAFVKILSSVSNRASNILVSPNPAGLLSCSARYAIRRCVSFEANVSCDFRFVPNGNLAKLYRSDESSRELIPAYSQLGTEVPILDLSERLQGFICLGGSR